MVKKPAQTGGKSLVIVESPAKARTISKFLGPRLHDRGQHRPHPRPAARGQGDSRRSTRARSGPIWASTSTRTSSRSTSSRPDKTEQVRKLKGLLKDAKELYLATDEDREGEAISWHLCEVLKPKVPVHRLVFHEITEEAIREALEHPREIDDDLVRAQEARRIVDRLYGYDVSPLLWRKMRPRLSAGRVQSVAVRLIVERERQRMAFVAATYLGPAGHLRQGRRRDVPGRSWSRSTAARFPRQPRFRSGHRQAEGPGAAAAGRAGGARSWPSGCGRPSSASPSVEDKPYTTRPYPPFTTSTLQQEANRKYGFTARRTMQVAQSLYETGHITYMRTDSTNLAAVAVEAARELVAVAVRHASICPSGPASLSDQGQERPGGPRGDSAGRPSLRFPEALRGRAVSPTSSSSTT